MSEALSVQGFCGGVNLWSAETTCRMSMVRRCSNASCGDALVERTTVTAAGLCGAAFPYGRAELPIVARASRGER